MQNQAVEIRLRILHGEPFSEAVTDETFQEETNEFGLVNLVIGSIDSNDFAAIDWGNGPFYLEVTLNGSLMGTSELLSVPYALYSGNAGPWKKNSETVYYDEGPVSIGASLSDSSAQLDVSSTTKGFLPPRMTYAQLQSISNPADGLIVFCSDCGSNGLGELALFMYGSWYRLVSECLGALPPVPAVPETLQEQITWKWHPVQGATGYKWNYTDNYETAIEVYSDTTYLENGLLCDNQYIRFVWAYNGTCISGSSQLSATAALCGERCPGLPFIEYGGKIYNTVQIGSQCWLKENLDIGIQVDGDVVQSDNGHIEKYCFDDLPGNCDIYGGLYLYNEMMDYNQVAGSRGICPEGWHIPTDYEWCTLSQGLDGNVYCNSIGFSGINAGIKMKANHGWDSGQGDNSSGYSALPGGVRYIGYYDGVGWASDIWTSTPSGAPGAYYRVFGSNQNGIGRYNSDISIQHGFAVRCLKDL